MMIFNVEMGWDKRKSAISNMALSREKKKIYLKGGREKKKTEGCTLLGIESRIS